LETQEVLSSLTQVLSIEIGTLVLGWFAFIIGMVIKDLLTAATFGVLFYLDPQFTEGDTVYIDGDEAIIQKIGLSVTIFKVIETGRWRYIRNEKIRYHKLEKLVEVNR